HQIERRFLLTSTIYPRIDDLGPAVHVHNTVLSSWFQQARGALLSEFFKPNALPLMVKEYTLTFHREIVMSPLITIQIQVHRVGHSLFTVHEQPFQDGPPSDESTVVYINLRPDHRPAPIPPAQREFLATHQVSMAE